MRLLGYILPLAALVLAWGLACGQHLSAPDSLGILQSEVSRIGIDTYTSKTRLSSVHRTDSQEVVLHLGYNWIYNTSPSVKDFVRNDRLLQLRHSHRLGASGVWAGQQVHVSEYQANRTAIVRIMQELRHQTQLDSSWALQSRLYAGVRRDERFGRTDFGPEAGAALQADMAPLPGVGSAGAAVLLSRAQLGPRQFQRLQADGVYASPAGLPAGAELRAGYYTVYSADYLSGNVQSIRSDTLFGNLRAHYRISEQFFLRSVTMVAVPGRRFVYRQLAGGAAEQQHFGYEQMQLETENRLLYTRNRLEAYVEFVYRERKRAYFLRNNRNLSPAELRLAEERERLKDVTESHTVWVWSVAWKFSRRHSLSAQTTAHLLRLDTPSQANNQDRDEVYYLGKATLESRWSPGLRTHFVLAAETRQFIFVKAQQSIENYHDRLLRWEPGFTWDQGSFSWSGSVQLWANYHVREAASEQLKNRSTRIYQQVHELGYRLPQNYRLVLAYTRRESRTGLLNWAAFSESPLDTLVSHDLAVSVEKKLISENKLIAMRAGYRLFYQGQHRKTGRAGRDGVHTLFLREITRQHGPEVYFSQQMHARFTLSAGLWLQVVDAFVRYRQSPEPYLGSVVSEEQLRQRRQAVYPYFNVSLGWYLGGLVR